MAVISTSGGWTAQYFDATGAANLGQIDFNGAPLGTETIDEIQEFSFTTGFLDGGPVNNYAVSYSGTFTLDAGEPAAFNLKASGAAELWIDGQFVVATEGYDNQILFGPCAVTGNPVCLCAGDKAAVAIMQQAVVDLAPGLHTIEVRFIDARGSKNDILALDWALGGADQGFSSLELAPPAEVTFDAEGDGEWSSLFSYPLLAVHSIMTPDGKVLSYGADIQGAQGGQEVYSVWDPDTGEYYLLDNVTGTDIFCSFPMIVPETGEILIIGGDTRGLDIGQINNGVADVNTFDYQTFGLTASPTGDMEFARWYPTMLTLESGQLLILGGRDFDGTYVGYPEIYTPGEGWRTLTGAYIAEYDIISDYPRAWVTSDGRIVTYAAQGTYEGAVTSVYVIDPTGNGSVTDTGVDVPVKLGWYMPAVMYDVDKALLIAQDGTAWIMDMTNGGVAFQQTTDVGLNRIWSDLMVLPDGRVMLSGGSNTDTSAVFGGVENTNNVVSIWNPDTGTWTDMAQEDTGRYYHSTLLLLADGTLLSSGGGAPGPLANTNAQIYHPDYLFNDDGTLADRPVIVDVPVDVLAVGQTFQITVDDAAAITEIAIMPFNTTTHSTNMAARRVEVDFVQIDADTIEITLPAASGTTPPGYWHIFALNDQGTPSVAGTLQIAPSDAYYMPDEFPLGLQFVFNGDAAFNPATNEIVVVEDLPDQMGSVGIGERFDFTKDFYLSFDLHMGDDDAGADGFAFFIHNDFRGASAIGAADSSGGFGAYYTQFGLGIAFDIFDNGVGDIPEDHTNLFDTESNTDLTAPVALGNLENNVWRTVEVDWDAATQTLNWSVDGVVVGSQPLDLVVDHLNGSDFGWVSFAGATGGVSNQMKVSFNAIDATYESGAAVVGQVGDAAGGYIDNLSQHLVLSGDATIAARTGVTLTDDVIDQTGGAMSNKRVDFTKDFEIAFDINFGYNGPDDGADGMAFVLHNDPGGAGALGVGGADLGARWLASGLAIEFDTFANIGRDADLVADHTNIFDTDGAVVDPVDPTIIDFAAARVTEPTALGEIEDGLLHRVVVTWNAATQTLSYSVGGVVIATIQEDIAATYFDGSNFAYFGWTGATGGIAHETNVLLQSISATFEDGSMVDDVQQAGGGGGNEGNNPPVATPYAAEIAEDAAPVDLTAAVLAGVTDPEGNPVQIVGVDDSIALGKVTLVNGVLTYEPNGAFDALGDGEQATDSFTLTVADIHGAAVPLVVTMTVNGIGEAGGSPGIVDQVAANFTVSGDAGYEGANGFLLTEAVGGQTGGAMSNQRVDMTKDFEVAFDINFGLIDGADGMAFVFHNAPAGAGALGVGAADFGARYLGDGLAIEFDTFGNIGRDADIAADHTNIFDTDVVIVNDAFEASRVTDPTALTELENGADHRVVVSWNAAAQTLSYSVDGVVITTLTQALVDLYFGGSDFVYFGWTAGTGGTAHESHVKLQALAATFEDGTVVDDVAGGGAGNNPPVATPYAAEIAEDAAPVDLTAAVLAGVTDPEGDPVQIVGLDDSAALGKATLVNGVLTYEPNGAFDALGDGEQATDSFTITVADSNGAAVPLVVTMTVNGIGEAGGSPGIVDQVAANFTVSGDAGYEGANGFLLTEAVGGQTGGAMSNQRVDMTKDFEVAFDINFGLIDGADGMAFVFHNAPAGAGALGVGAADFGARYLGDGLAIEFDTFGNIGRDADIAADHTNIFDTDVVIVNDAFEASRVTDPTALTELENGADHRVVVTWNAATQTLSYSVDGVVITTLTQALVDLYFGGSDFVYFGWTAGTGGTAHESHVKLQALAATFEDGTVVDDVAGGGAGNNPPVATPYAAEIAEDAAPVDLTAAVLAGVTDPEGDPVQIVGLDDSAALGKATLVNGVLTYEPNGAFDALGDGEQATDSFTVTVADSNGAAVPLVVTMTVNGIGEAGGSPGVVDQVAANFTVSGDAGYEGANGFLLTEAVGGQTGGAMSNQRVDMTKDFEVAFDINFGAIDGADGMAFVFHNAPAGAGALGVGAADFGARYLGDGLAIEFDTFGNIGRDADIAADHTNIFDTDVVIVDDAFEASRVTDPTALAELEDGQDHRVVVSWDAVAQVLSYSVDGLPIATLTAPLVDLYFGGSDFVYFGWTAGTGGTAHESHVKLQALAATFEDGTVVDDVAGGGVPDPVNTPPVAGDIGVALNEDVPATTLTPALIAAAFDADGDGMSVTGFDAAGLQGVVTLIGGQLYYDPNGAFDALNAGEQAQEVFTAIIADGKGGEDVATITVTVNGVDDGVPPPANTAPMAGDIAVAVAEDAASGDLAPAAIAAGFDADGDPLDVTGFDATGTQGLVTLVGGQLVYDPNGAFDALNDGEQAVDSFDFTIDDGQGGQDVGTVTVTINGAGVPAGGGGGSTYGDPEPAPTFVGTEAGETLRGGAGADVVSGLGGGDNLFGGGGDDVVLGGAGDDVIKGNGGKDDLRGGADDDILYGNSEADILWGGSGNDTLYGGADGDVFVFGVGDDEDTVADFGNGDSLLFFGGVFASAAAAHAASVETAQGLVFDLGNGDILTVAGEDKLSLTVDDIAIL